MKQKIFYISAVVMLVLSSCGFNVVYVQFTEDELLWSPYETSELLIFEDDSLQLDTIEVLNQGNLQGELMCEMPIVCSGTEYVPASLWLIFNKGENEFLKLYLYKDENEDSFSGIFDNNNDSVNIVDFSNTVDFSFYNIDYKSVNVYQFQNSSNTGCVKIYYKKGIGLLKYEDSEKRLWSLKKRIQLN